MKEDDKESKEAFAKQLEISSQFSYDYEKYDDSKVDLPNSEIEQKSKKTKLVRLSEDDWKYL